MKVRVVGSGSGVSVLFVVTGVCVTVVKVTVITFMNSV